MMNARSIGAAAAFVLAGCGVVAAMPAPSIRTEAPIVLVRDGCGPGFHRGPGEGCVPNGDRGYGGRDYVEPRVIGPREVAPVRLPPPCPRGYVRDPDPARPICYPRF